MASTEPGRSIEGRVQRTATVTLGLVLAAHIVQETGRDALFLAHIPAERLPWVYIAAALLALLIVRVSGTATRGAAGTAGARSHGRRLVLLQLLAATSAFGFWWAMASPRPWLYYALYVWSGVISSVVVVTFWVLMAEFFTVTQGKRLFASIAMGGSLGAVGGAAIATALAPYVSAETLLLASSLLFAGSAAGPLMLPAAPEAEADGDEGSGDGVGGVWEGIRAVATHPYAGRVAGLVAIASATLTLGDYLFMSVLAEEVDADQLSTWLARVYLGLNLLSIVVLATGVTPLIRRLGVDRALILLPALLAVASFGVLLGAALVSVIVLKTADGTLRHSLHKTATEILFLPMDSSLRGSVKGVIDLVANSAAKALASVAILALTALAHPRPAIAGLLLLFALTWGLSALRLRGPYLDVFRRTLRLGSIETRIDFPELDLDSAGSLIRALSDRDERVVLAAMELLHERDRCSLIPSLILYHPSPDVVARAIDIFAASGREEVLDFGDRLLAHEYARVRSAIVRATAVLAPDREQLEALSRSTCPCVRVSAVAGRVAHGWIDPDAAEHALRGAVEHHEPDTRMAVANAAKLRYDAVYRQLLVDLARDPNEGVAREAVRAIARSGDDGLTGPLVGLLGDRRIRDLVRDALLARGDAALALLARALEDPETPAPVLRHVPQTISRFPPGAAVETLLDALRNVRSGMVRYKILRGLQPLLAEESLGRSGTERVVDALRATVERALSLLASEVTLLHGQRREPARETAGGRLLVDLASDKRRLATGRIFLLLSLLYPKEDFRKIEAGIRSERARRQASGIELLEHVLTYDLRQAVVGLVAPGSAEARLQLASPERAAAGESYDALVRRLSVDASEAVRAFALYHAGELGVPLDPDGPSDAAQRDAARGASARDRALAIIERLPEALARRGARSAPIGAG